MKALDKGDLAKARRIEVNNLGFEKMDRRRERDQPVPSNASIASSKDGSARAPGSPR
ncbi:MAG: hypothetical protein ACYDH5_17020 [Acidimicrobiales bacterium]